MLKKIGLLLYVPLVVLFAVFLWNPSYSLIFGATIDSYTAFRGLLIHTTFLVLLALFIYYERTFVKLVYGRMALAIFSAFFFGGLILGPILLVIDGVRVLRSEKAKEHR